jgi:hypothetical protein
MKKFIFIILLTITLNQINLSNCSLSIKKNSNSFWFRFPIDPLIVKGYFNIIGKITAGLCVSALIKNGRLTQQKCGTDDHLVWTAQRQNNGYVILSKNGMVFDNKGNENRNGNPLLGWTRHNGPNQIWLIEVSPDRRIAFFRNPKTNGCLDDTGRAQLGHVYHLWKCGNGNRNQWFRIQPVALVAPVIQTKPIKIDVSLAGRTGSIPALTKPEVPTIPVLSTAPVILTKPLINIILDLDPIQYFKPLEGNIDISTLRN